MNSSSGFQRATAAVFVLIMLLALGTVSMAQAQTDASAALATKVQDLEKQLEEVRAQLAAMQIANAAAAANAPKSAAPAAAQSNKIEIASLAGPPVVPQDATPAPAAAPEKPSLAGLLGSTTISGFVDTYYGYNSNQPANRITPYRNFDINSGQFGLNMIELVADKAVAADSRLGYHIAFGFGQAMNQINQTEVGPGGTEPNFSQYLKEGYLSYLAPVGSGLQINVGKFVTPAGAEVIESKDNWNYSRGLLFALAIPYFHYGMSAKYTFNSKFALTGFLMNGWNNSVDNNTGKTTGFAAAWTPNSKFSWINNYLVGPEQTDDNGHFRHLYDSVMTYSPNAKLSFMANYDYGHDRIAGGFSSSHWSGIAGYIKYAFNDKWTVATRGEYFNDHDGFATGTSQNLSDFTLTLQRMLASKLMSRLEFRRDMSDQDTFFKGTGIPVSAQNTVSVGLIYAFSSADAK